MLWSSVKLWKNAAVYIIGGGPSLIGQDLCIKGGLESLLKTKRVIGVNNAYQFGDWVDVCYFGDAKWLDWHAHILKDYPGLVISSNPKMRDHKTVLYLQRGKSRGIEERKKMIAWNRSSGASAINLAIHLGASKIILLGYDMKRNDKVKNFHRDHRERNPEANPFERFLKVFPKIKKDADKMGIEILNATPDSAIDCFRKVDIRDVT